MRCKLLYTVIFLLSAVCARAQELFPVTEPASTIPKGVLGIRFIDETYNEVDRIRNLFALKLMYGVTPKLTVEVIPSVSNHHNKQLPPDFPVHNTPQIGVTHPYLFNGAEFYAKYRVLSFDGTNSHFRIALYGEYSLLHVAHDEAEPELLDDNSGAGGGVISTYLKDHFAVSFTGGIIKPFKYKGDVPDEIPGLPGVPATVTYGTGYNYSLSFGYLLYPGSYSGYRQTNWNVYMELMGKSYAQVQMQVGQIYYNAPQYSISTAGNKALQARQYVDVYPGVQAIIRSDTRVDFSVGFPLVSRSYEHYYPVYNLGVQRYFNFHKKRK